MSLPLVSVTRSLSVKVARIVRSVRPAVAALAVIVLLVLAGTQDVFRHGGSALGYSAPNTVSKTADRTTGHTPEDAALRTNAILSGDGNMPASKGGVAHAPHAPVLHDLGPTPFTLVLSTSQVTLSQYGGGAPEVVITNSLGTAFWRPMITSGDVSATLSDPAHPESGTVGMQKSWHLQLNRVGSYTAGSSYVTITVPNAPPAQLLVKWLPLPSASATKGSLVRTDGDATITYTASFTLAVHGTDFSGATLGAYMQMQGGGDCLNVHAVQPVAPGEQNTYSVSCTIVNPSAATDSQTAYTGGRTLYVNLSVNMPDGKTLPVSPSPPIELFYFIPAL